MVDSSPWLFAATHVLHRHLAPRHPPLALHSLKSHSPRAFERAENSFEDRGPTTYFQDARARYAVLKVPAETKLVSPAAVCIDPERSSTEPAPVLPIEQGTTPRAPGGTAASRPLPQNRAVKAGRHDVSVVPATARLLELRRARATGWCTGVEVRRDAS